MTVNWMWKLGWRVKESDLEGGGLKVDRNPIEVGRFEVRQTRAEVLEPFCQLVGVLAVLEGANLTVVGTRQSLVLFKDGWSHLDGGRLDRGVIGEIIACHDLIEYLPGIDDLWIKGRENRIQENRLRHKVCELYPQLRDWDAPRPPEVSFKSVDGIALIGVA